jgi:beta-xylosidase
MEQGKTVVNGPHQGALVDTPGGEWWFLHFQDKGAYGRIVHLQPVSWHDGWPVIGSDPAGTGKGEPVRVHARPVLSSHLASKAYAVDAFEESGPGLQWQWQANPEPGWCSLTARPGFLRLDPRPVLAPNLWNAPSLLLRKFPSERFTANVDLDGSRLKPGDRAGLIVFGTDYACLVLERSETGFSLVLKFCPDANRGMAEQPAASVPVASGKVFLRVQVHPGALCTFSWRTDGKEFQPVGPSFTAKPGRWVGAKVGLFAETQSREEKGFADFGSFRVDEE